MVLCALLIAGCGVKKADLVGSYSGELTLTQEQKSNPATAILANVKPTLTLKDDDTFEMTMLVPIKGTWTFEAETVTLNMETAMGVAIPQDQARPVKLVIKERGKVLAGTVPEGDAPLIFRRNEP